VWLLAACLRSRAHPRCIASDDNQSFLGHGPLSSCNQEGRRI
jgi:hypothetical protein